MSAFRPNRALGLLIACTALAGCAGSADATANTDPRATPRALTPTPSKASATTDRGRAPPSAAQQKLRAAIDGAASYLVRACGPDGRFVYRTDVDPEVTYPESYNMLRHAGAMYALASYQLRWPSVEVAAALGRAARFLEAEVGPLEDHPGLMAVWSKGGKVAKLGGTGLALVALGTMSRAAPTAVDVARLRPLGAFVRFMQKDDGSFYSKHFPGEGPSDEWVSLYYPGEAALGLLELQRADPRGDWTEPAVRALSFLATSRQGRSEVEADHWALIATSALLGSERSTPRSGEVTSLLRAHGRQIAESMLAQRHAHASDSPLHGCFDPHGYTTPTATRLEGLQAALDFLDSDAEADLRERILVAVDAGVAFLLRTQVAAGPLRGAMPRAHPTSRAPRAGEVRIDYPQHAMSAWMQAYDRLETAAQRKRPGRSTR